MERINHRFAVMQVALATARVALQEVYNRH
jgi:hypothetical protein